MCEIWRKGRWRHIVIVTWSAVCWFCWPVRADVDYETLKKGVVKITTPSETGAGIIVGIDNRGAPLIVTAWHVVAEAEDIQVEFRGWSEKLPGTRFEKYNESLDLAVVIVDSPLGKSLIQDLPPLSFSDVETLQLGAEVSAIGHPAGYDWQTAVLANKIQELRDPDDSRRFRFTKNNIERGNSGGPAFDSRGQLIGMVTRVVPPGHTVAVKISEVLNLVKYWGFNTSRLMSSTQVPPSQVIVPTGNEVLRSSQQASLANDEEEKPHVRRRKSAVENLQMKLKIAQVCGSEFTPFDEEDLKKQVKEELRRSKSEVDGVEIAVAAGYRAASYSTDPGTTIQAYAKFIACDPQDGEETCRISTTDCNRLCSFSDGNIREANQKDALIRIAEFIAKGFRGQKKGEQLPCTR